MLTRRTFLDQVGRVGGSAAIYRAMDALGLLADAAVAEATAGRTFVLDGPNVKRKTRIAVLGAGLAGLGVAYELGKKGYDCRLLEARARPGGRAHTIRGGTIEVEEGGARQICHFEEGHYLNPGPARIPQHHVTLDYCRELGVAIEPFAQSNESAYFYHEQPVGGALAGKRLRVREVKADLYGYTAELLAKAVSQTALDTGLTAEDKDRLLDFLAGDGSLGRGGEWRYQRGVRAGYRLFPGAGDSTGTLNDAYKFHDLLEAGFGRHFAEDYDPNWEPMLFQMVGGNDHLPRAFAKQLGDRITYQAVVSAIRQTPNGVRITYHDGKAERTLAADYAVCTIPLSVLRDIPADFAPPMQRAIAGVSYAATGKVGIQFKRRFWEEDDRIFGGITRTDLPITQIFYPSYGYLSKKGVLVGCYNFGRDAVEYGALSPEERTRRALKEGTKIHPQYTAAYENAFSVAWHRVPFTKGGWGEYGGTSRRDLYPILNQPDGRIYLAGEHLSYLNAWMAGALESARRVARLLHERVAATAAV